MIDKKFFDKKCWTKIFSTKSVWTKLRSTKSVQQKLLNNKNFDKNKFKPNNISTIVPPGLHSLLPAKGLLITFIYQI